MRSMFAIAGSGGLSRSDWGGQKGLFYKCHAPVIRMTAPDSGG